MIIILLKIMRAFFLLVVRILITNDRFLQQMYLAATRKSIPIFSNQEISVNISETKRTFTTKNLQIDLRMNADINLFLKEERKAYSS